jgi:hypothetical protein
MTPRPTLGRRASAQAIGTSRSYSPLRRERLTRELAEAADVVVTMGC